MTNAQHTGSWVLRSEACTAEGHQLVDDNLWSNTFIEAAPALWDLTASFSGALDVCSAAPVNVAIIRHLDGALNLPDTALWMTRPYTVILTGTTDPDASGASGTVDETADVLDAFEHIRTELGLTQQEMFSATGIRKRTYHSWARRPAGRRPRMASQGRLWELADTAEDLRHTLDQPANHWLRADPQRIEALLTGRFNDLVDLAVAREPFPAREIGTSVSEGIAEHIEMPVTGGRRPGIGVADDEASR